MWSSSAERASSISASSGPSFDPRVLCRGVVLLDPSDARVEQRVIAEVVRLPLSDELADPLDHVVRSAFFDMRLSSLLGSSEPRSVQLEPRSIRVSRQVQRVGRMTLFAAAPRR